MCPTIASARSGSPSSFAASGHTVDPAEVVAWCREQMANFKAPREVVVVDALPINPSGKVMKFVLRDQFESDRAAKRGVSGEVE